MEPRLSLCIDINLGLIYWKAVQLLITLSKVGFVTAFRSAANAPPKFSCRGSPPTIAYLRFVKRSIGSPRETNNCDEQYDHKLRVRHNGVPRTEHAVHQEPRIKRLVTLAHLCFLPCKAVIGTNKNPAENTDRKLRTKSLESLRNFLSARQVASTLSPLDVLKLWKGLFYALWMCDRPLPQQALAQDLADLVYVLPDREGGEVVAAWLRGFWATMAREWTGIDVLRLDKFLLLVRRVLGASLAWMKVREEEGTQKKRRSSGKEKKTSRWDKKKVDAVLGVLGDYPFALEEDAKPRGEEEVEEEAEKKGHGAHETQDAVLTPKYVPVGLKLHALDIWVDEAEKVGLLEEDDEEAKDIMRRITEMVDELEKGTTSPAVRIRSKQSLLDDRLPFNNTAGSDAGSE